jgi:hypothetical protein
MEGDMEFRHPKAASEVNAATLDYLTKNLSDPEAGREEFEQLVEKLGNSVDRYPEWHPILTLPGKVTSDDYNSLSDVPVYRGIDHTRYFVRGFVTCPYLDGKADKLVEAVNKVEGLTAYRLETPLYMDDAYPVVVEAYQIVFEGDGTIRSRDAIAWFTEKIIKNAMDAQVAETWWTMRTYLLGAPHGSRSSLFVNQYTGGHIRKILETLNNSGVFGPIKEWSLEMLSQKKRNTICETLIRAAFNNRGEDEKFTFELCGETCFAEVRDDWEEKEFFVNVKIGKSDLWVTGYYYVDKDQVSHSDPCGKKDLAEKFL